MKAQVKNHAMNFEAVQGVSVPAIDQYGQVIDVMLSARRDLAAARRFFTRALRAGTVPAEVTTDRALHIRGSWTS